MRAINRLVFINLFFYKAVFRISTFHSGNRKRRIELNKSRKVFLKPFFQKKKNIQCQVACSLFPRKIHGGFFLYKLSTLTNARNVAK